MGLIRPVRNYLEEKAWANLEQILELDATLDANVQSHDSAVRGLLQALTSVHSGLLSNKEFTDSVYSLLTPERLAELGVNSVEQIFGLYPPSDRLGLVAQYVVNCLGDQPPRYSTARFWNSNREVLLAFLNVPDVRERYAGALSLGDHLTSVGMTLVRQLKTIRRDLSFRYDIPYVVGDAGNSAA